MGYIHDQRGIISRYLAEEGNWDGHLNHCKQQIIDYLADLPRKDVVILGSGWLLDLPMDWLLKNADHIYLIDVHHPNQITHKFRKQKNVHFLKIDVLGGLANEVFKWNKKDGIANCLKQIDAFKSNLDLNIYDGHIVSLNILNQLDIIILDYLKNKGFVLSEQEENSFRSKIQQIHLDSLPKGNTLLISDVVQYALDHRGKKSKEKNLIHVSLDCYEKLGQWKWVFDTRKSYDPEYDTQMLVKAFKL